MIEFVLEFITVILFILKISQSLFLLAIVQGNIFAKS